MSKQQMQPEQQQMQTPIQFTGGQAFEGYGYDQPQPTPPSYAQATNVPVVGRPQVYVQQPVMPVSQTVMTSAIPAAGPANNVTMVNMQAPPTTTTVIVNNQPYYRSDGYIWLSCVVFWCCNPLFGLIAFILALAAHSASDSNNQTDARNLGRASMWVSISGMIISVIATIVVIVILTTAASAEENFTYP